MRGNVIVHCALCIEKYCHYVIVSKKHGFLPETHEHF